MSLTGGRLILNELAIKMKRQKLPAQNAFTLIELLVTTTLTALLMLAITSLFISFLNTAYKTRISQSLRENGSGAMQKMIALLRSSSSIVTDCSGDAGNGIELSEITFTQNDGLTTTLIEKDDRIASSSAQNGDYYLSSTSDDAEPDRLQGLTFTCYNSDLGPKYIEINFQLGTNNELIEGPRESALSFHSGVSLRN